MININQIRLDTPACQQKVHLNNAGASLQPNSIIKAIRDYFELEAITGGYETAALKAAEITKFPKAVAKLFHCEARNIAFTTNATEAYNKALSSIPFEHGDVILTTDDDYVSNQIGFLFLQKRIGVKVIRAAKLETGGVDVNSIENLIKKHQPKLVAVTHVPTNSGLIQNVYEIGQLCREQDILYLVDGCQSAGQLEVDVSKMGCDFYSATFRKFLRGPRGTGFLYVSNKVLERNLEPIFPDLHGANWTDNFEYQLDPTAKRFEYWERNFANVLGAKAAAEYAQNIGMSAIENRVKMLAKYTREQFTTLPDFQIMDKGQDLCGIVTLHSKVRNWQKMKANLIANNFNVSVPTTPNALIDFREKGVNWMLRVAPHYYNTKAEIDRLIEFLR